MSVIKKMCLFVCCCYLNQNMKTNFLALLPSFFHVLSSCLSSRLCAAGIPRCPEADPHGGNEVTGHASCGEPCRSGGGPSQNGDPDSGGSTSGSATTQAQTQRHEHPDTLWLLRRHMTSKLHVTRRLKVP